MSNGDLLERIKARYAERDREAARMKDAQPQASAAGKIGGAMAGCLFGLLGLAWVVGLIALAFAAARWLWFHAG
jgi:uncharacterized membrane protein